MNSLIEQAIIFCLFIPLFGADDPHSTCLTSEQMERRAIVLQCERATHHVPGPSRGVEVEFIVTGNRKGVEALALTMPDKSQYTCILEKSRKNADR